MRIKSVVALMCIGLILIMCGCRETREKLSVEEYFYKDGMGVDREPEMEAGGKIKQEYVSEDKEKEISENKAVLYIIYTVYKLHNICRCFFKTDRYAFLFWLSKEQAHRS